jgi:hypothetical protein
MTVLLSCASGVAVRCLSERREGGQPAITDPRAGNTPAAPAALD